MVSSRLNAMLLWALPAVAIVALFGWAILDFLNLPFNVLSVRLLILLLADFALTLLGLRFGYAPLRRLGLLFLLAMYFVLHLTLLPLETTAALGFLTLALFAVEVRIVADRFVPLYAGKPQGVDRERIGSAVQRSLVRVVAVSGVAFLVSALAADLALAGALPVTTIPTALFLAAGLIGVILLLALWPLLERRETG